MEDSRNYQAYELYINRELSWLKFEERVLNEAADESNPLLERFKFLAITASNLDEFFMIRVASLKALEMTMPDYRDISGMTAGEQLKAVSKGVHSFAKGQYEIFEKERKLLEDAGIYLINDVSKLSPEEKRYVEDYFDNSLFSILTPVVVDSSSPFPLIKSRSLNIGLLLQKKGKGEFGYVQIPSAVNRIIELPFCSKRFIMLEAVIKANLHKLFKDYLLEDICDFRITRDAELGEIEYSDDDILSIISRKVENRKWSRAVRLEVSADVSDRMLNILLESQNLTSEDTYLIPGSLDLTFLNKVYSLESDDKLKIEMYIPKKLQQFNLENSMWDEIEKENILLCHPFESFDSVVEFLYMAANDPDVLAIKQTLYRVADKSRIIDALLLAAKKGKQVTVLVELKARFDEANNIEWAQRLEKAGCTVLYGSENLKTHCKIALVIKQKGHKLIHYVHLATGNYNEDTAKLYTDIGLFSSDEAYGRDAVKIFNMLSGYNKPEKLEKLSVAPYGLKEQVLYLINREKENALEGKPSGIRAKMNSLCDSDVIAALYEAAHAGVSIELLVRGICCLRPGIEGVSENIRVKSIVGNFLEHSRIYSFENAGDKEYYCASADWMPRNFERRIELMFPVEGRNNIKKLNRVLTMTLSDNCKAYELSDDGSYIRLNPEDNNIIDSQNLLKEQ